MGTNTGRRALPARRAAAAIRDLHTAYFGFVMATGIISTGAFLLGPSWLSLALLVAACAGLVVLTVALSLRLVFFGDAVAMNGEPAAVAFGERDVR